MRPEISFWKRVAAVGSVREKVIQEDAVVRGRVAGGKGWKVRVEGVGRETLVGEK